jgi:hypothetical protein
MGGKGDYLEGFNGHAFEVRPLFLARHLRASRGEAILSAA